MSHGGRIAGRSCIVTGAARGIGSGIAKRLAEEGARVCVADLDADGAARVATDIEAAGGSAIAMACDVAERESVRALVRRSAEEFGRLDVIFNNAGIARVDRFLDVEEAHWNAIMRVNALGVLLCMQEAARQMIAQGGGGRIVNTASIAGKQGYPLQAHYCASKFAVVALTQSGARALAEHGITVNAICPGVVETELWDQLDREFIELGETEREGQAMEEFSAGILLGRVSSPADVAAVAVFLASDDAAYITGQSINVDGGMVLQ
jgi:meso-butanediol dehydrogenase / (S,S)-butanediol dehydrogenase / diacetyl reductase